MFKNSKNKSIASMIPKKNWERGVAYMMEQNFSNDGKTFESSQP